MTIRLLPIHTFLTPQSEIPLCMSNLGTKRGAVRQAEGRRKFDSCAACGWPDVIVPRQAYRWIGGSCGNRAAIFQALIRALGFRKTATELICPKRRALFFWTWAGAFRKTRLFLNQESQKMHGSLFLKQRTSSFPESARETQILKVHWLFFLKQRKTWFRESEYARNFKNSGWAPLSLIFFFPLF